MELSQSVERLRSAATRLFHERESVCAKQVPAEPTHERLYTVTEAAEMMGITRQRVHQLIKDERIEAKKHGRLWFIPERAVGKVSPSTKKPGRPRTKRKYTRRKP